VPACGATCWVAGDVGCIGGLPGRRGSLAGIRRRGRSPAARAHQSLAVVLVSASWRVKLNSWQSGHQPAAYHTRSTRAAGAAAAVAEAVAGDEARGYSLLVYFMVIGPLKSYWNTTEVVQASHLCLSKHPF
jgi:hypothetical protein